MRYVEEGRLYLEMPAICRAAAYGDGQARENRETRLYRHIREAYRFPDATPFPVNRTLDREPAHYAAELIADMVRRDGAPEPEAMIGCYRSYPLTEHINAVLYIAHRMNRRAMKNVFSLCDAGSLSPLLAVEWCVLSGCDALLVAMEQTGPGTAPAPQGGAFEPADAVAVVPISGTRGRWAVAAYDYRFSGCVEEPCERLAERLRSESLDFRDVLVIPQCADANARRRYLERFPFVFHKDDGLDHGTADPFYSLHDAIHAGADEREYLVLAFCDSRGTGELLLKQVIGG